ncbi:two-component sensor histidine kinase [Shewanella sairae]|uniref:Two-component sensor histidine kinase n=1 Tax=Shewanella sairae TaxID=190310 RepID=A0ABQ4P8W7_9GAMM|nr:sensor histidine kinase [Shewanella sairae]MCL1131487.1 sensor histidine kinase [Shewanella sairae]GIU43907.1 two-component sensor histidine kinase [Shewanella sairae]
MTQDIPNPASKTEDKYAWVYLINLVFYFIPYFIIDMPQWQILLSLAALAPFIYCYFWAYRSNSSRAHLPILAMIAIAIAVTPINTGSLSLFTFAAFFIGFFYPLQKAALALISLIGVLALLNLSLNFDHYYWVIYGAGLIAGVGLFGVIERRRIENLCKQQKSQQEIHQLATMLERERIARDLHDIMGHSLSSISLKAELAEKLLAKNDIEQAQQQLSELNSIARDSLSQIRQTVSGYKHKGLAASVTNLCQTLRDKGLSVQLEGDIPNLSSDLETHLILSLTELCNNVIRHSQAQECSLSFSQNEQQIIIQITDNGQLDNLEQGNGLKGIRERLQQFQGTLSWDLSQQCQFTIRLPQSGMPQR